MGCFRWFAADISNARSDWFSPTILHARPYWFHQETHCRLDNSLLEENISTDVHTAT